MQRGPFKARVCIHKQQLDEMNTMKTWRNGRSEKVHQSGNIWREMLLCYKGVKSISYKWWEWSTKHSNSSEKQRLESECLCRMSMNPITNDLHMTWDLDLVFEEFHFNDYQLLQNELVEENIMERQVYNSIVFSITKYHCGNMNFSLSRWLIACELHYLPL